MAAGTIFTLFEHTQVSIKGKGAVGDELGLMISRGTRTDTRMDFHVMWTVEEDQATEHLWFNFHLSQSAKTKGAANALKRQRSEMEKTENSYC